MSNTVITCPECRKKFKGRADLLGKKIRCPFCTQPFVVPRGEAAEDAITLAPKDPGPGRAGPKNAAPAAKTAPKAPAQKAAPPTDKNVGWDDEDEDQNPYGITHIDLAPRCPHCAKKMLNPEAVVCVHCGYNTLTRIHGETKKVIETSGGELFAHLLPGLLTLGGILFIVIFLAVFALAWPSWVAGSSWIAWTDHESIRMWLTVMLLFVIFGLGQFTMKRLIVEPKPPDKEKD